MGRIRSTGASIVVFLCAVACDGAVNEPTVSDAGAIGSRDGSVSNGNADGDGDGDSDAPVMDASLEPGDGSNSGNGGDDGSSTADASTDGDDGADGDGDGVPVGQVPAIIAVGYDGLRVVSRDHGQTWGDAQLLNPAAPHADDPYLLRGIAWGNGIWIATGGQVLRSDDGVQWEPIDYPDCRATVIESIAYGNGTFVAACGRRAYLTTDGSSWRAGGEFGEIGHPKIRFAENLFVVAGDRGDSFTSPDGESWTPLQGVSYARVCEGRIVSRNECPGDDDTIWVEDNVWLRAEWNGHIQRSENGTNFQRVYTHPQGSSAYNFAAGYAAP